MEDIIVNNRMIGEFMGGCTQTTWIGGIPTECFYMPDAHILDYITDFEHQLPYHSSWDMLMPVAEKIIYTSWWQDGDSWAIEIQRALSFANIRRVYDSVLEFIYWYNSNKKQ